MGLRPLHDNVFIVRIKQPETTASGLHIPESAAQSQGKGFECRVLAAGPGRRNPKTGTLEPITVAAGDTVILGQYQGTETQVPLLDRLDLGIGEQETVLVVRETEILAVVARAPGMTDLMVPPESITPEMLDDVPPIQTADDGEAFQGPKRRLCGMYEGCRGEGYLDDSTDSGSGRTVYCDCAAGKALEKFEFETRAERGERLAERYTREDGSSR